ncbi:MAG: TetR/AcrR family transcriptional regulator [Gemmiger sp.]
MGRENKKEAVAAFHRAQILQAAEELFTEKGFEAATIGDLCQRAGYSRRTLYAYYQSKEEIYQGIVEKGLLSLRDELRQALAAPGNFSGHWEGVCRALYRYHTRCPHGRDAVNHTDAACLDTGALPASALRILALGDEINDLLASLLREGQRSGEVRADLPLLPAVYLLWPQLSALFALVQSKGPFFARRLGMTPQDYLAFGCRQILRSLAV